MSDDAHIAANASDMPDIVAATEAVLHALAERVQVAVHQPGTASCGTFRAGHDPHWIQVVRVAPRGVPRPVHDVRLLDATTVELDVDLVDGSVDGPQWETVVRRNHDAERLHRAWERVGDARLISGASLLQIGPASGAATFSVTDGPLGHCGGAR